MKVLLYGRLADAIGREIGIALYPGGSVGDLRNAIAAQHPAITAALARSRACVGGMMVADSHLTSFADTVEFLPPVSGG